MPAKKKVSFEAPIPAVQKAVSTLLAIGYGATVKPVSATMAKISVEAGSAAETSVKSSLGLLPAGVFALVAVKKVEPFGFTETIQMVKEPPRPRPSCPFGHADVFESKDPSVPGGYRTFCATCAST